MKAPTIPELGTSFDYSGIWLAEATAHSSGPVTTTELQPHKYGFAPDMAAPEGFRGHIDLSAGDAMEIPDFLTAASTLCWRSFERTSICPASKDLQCWPDTWLAASIITQRIQPC